MHTCGRRPPTWRNGLLELARSRSLETKAPPRDPRPVRCRASQDTHHPSLSCRRSHLISSQPRKSADCRGQGATHFHEPQATWLRPQERSVCGVPTADVHPQTRCIERIRRGVGREGRATKGAVRLTLSRLVPQFETTGPAQYPVSLPVSERLLAICCPPVKVTGLLLKLIAGNRAEVRLTRASSGNIAGQCERRRIRWISLTI